MRNRFYKVFSLTLFIFLTGSKMVLAQPPAIQRAIENVKESVEELVGVRDENSSSEVVLRIDIFTKVVDLSTSEAKDLKVKLLPTETTSKDVANWKETVLSKLNQILAYYEDELELPARNKDINLAAIKAIANDFKDWRDKNYLPLAQEITDFLLLSEEAKAIQITKKRSQKIGDDVLKLQKGRIRFGIGANLDELLNKANRLIDESEKLYNEAEAIFLIRYVAPLTASSTATTTQSMSSPTPALQATSTTPTIDTSTVTSTEATNPPLPPPTSIKDLVKASFTKLKDAYLVFIEMSNLVRKLLR